MKSLISLNENNSYYSIAKHKKSGFEIFSNPLFSLFYRTKPVR